MWETDDFLENVSIGYCCADTETWVDETVFDAEMLGSQYTVIRRDRNKKLFCKAWGSGEAGGVLIVMRVSLCGGDGVWWSPWLRLPVRINCSLLTVGTGDFNISH